MSARCTVSARRYLLFTTTIFHTTCAKTCSSCHTLHSHAIASLCPSSPMLSRTLYPLPHQQDLRVALWPQGIVETQQPLSILLLTVRHTGQYTLEVQRKPRSYSSSERRRGDERME
ncbi:hypothetical protein C8R44DRAFT_772837 [Mycena epipterygia]|nr:hypothetical protein C8R44DRAFT_772837 [Mycena epipterygia]